MARQLTAHLIIRDEDGKLVSQGTAAVVDGVIHVQPLIDQPATSTSSGSSVRDRLTGATSTSSRSSVRDRLTGKR